MWVKLLGFVFIISLILSCSFRKEVKESNMIRFSKDVVNVDKNLLDRFETYWSLRIGRKITDMFAFEAPYIRDMVSFAKYANYIKLFSKNLSKIHVKGYKCEKPFYCCFFLEEYFVKPGDVLSVKTVGFKDCWVEVKGKWYHVINNPLFFPELQ